MIPIIQLWLPILLSAVIVFIASSILHMVHTYHRSHYKKLANEGAVREAIGKENPAPGYYTIPYCKSSSEMKSPEMMEKFTKGPVGYLTIIPNRPPAVRKYPPKGPKNSLWESSAFLAVAIRPANPRAIP